MVVKKEVETFCQTTSMKGIPRAFKAEHKATKLAWILAVVIMLSMACYQVTILVMEYLDYPTYTVTTERKFHPKDDPPVLPTLTVCNENPFSTLKPGASSYGLPSIEEYYAMIDKLTQCTNCSLEQLGQMSLMKKLMRNPNAYFQNLGSEYSRLVGHDRDHFIVSCKEIVFIGMTFLDKDCSEITKIELSQSPDYFNCYRVTLPNDYDMEEYGMIGGVSLVLYLDNITPTDNFNISELLDSTLSVTKNGAVVIPTHHQGSAFPALDGIQIPAGMSTNIQFSISEEHRLEPPWGMCQPTDVEGYEFIKMCLSDCLQEGIKNNCSCTDTRMVKHMEDGEHPFCLKVGDDPAQVSVNFLCATDQLRTDPVTECMKQCPTMCKEYSYKTELSLSNWPSPSSMRGFYDTYIEGKDYESYFTTVKQVISGNCSGDLDCMIKFLMAQKLLEQNFLEVKFHLSDIRYIYTEEKKKFAVVDFFSKLGGTLNLWAGITVVILFEMVEVLGKIIMHKFQSRSKDDNQKKEPSEPQHSKTDKSQTIKVKTLDGYCQDDNEDVGFKNGGDSENNSSIKNKSTNNAFFTKTNHS